MELEGRSMRMLLQQMPKACFVVLFVTFFALLVSALVAGLLGPNMWTRQSVSSWECEPDSDGNPPSVFSPALCDGVDLLEPGAVFTAVISPLNLLNQQLQVQMTPVNVDESKTTESEVLLNVQVFGKVVPDQGDWIAVREHDTHSREISCQQNVTNCTTLTVAHMTFLNFSQYLLNITMESPHNATRPPVGDIVFTFWFVNHTFTLYELWWRFVFLFVTFVVTFGFAFRLRRFEWAEWTLEQKWTAVLLGGCMAFNNPFFPLELLVAGWFPVFLNRLLMITFVALLLLFWLVVFDGLRREDAARTWLKFYTPKLVLVGVFWLTSLILFTWDQTWANDDPQHADAENMAGFVVLRVIGLIAMFAYLLWLAYCALRACGDVKVMPFVGTRLKFFLSFALFVLLITVGGFIFGWQLGSESTTAAEFLVFQTLLNLYVWTLGICYMPTAGVTTLTGARNGFSSDRAGMIRLEEDSDSGIDSSAGPDSDDSYPRRTAASPTGIPVSSDSSGSDNDREATAPAEQKKTQRRRRRRRHHRRGGTATAAPVDGGVELEDVPVSSSSDENSSSSSD